VVQQEAEVLATHKKVFWQQVEEKKRVTETFNVIAWEKARLDNNSSRVGEFEKNAQTITKDIDKDINQLYDVALKDQEIVTQTIENEKKRRKDWLEQNNQVAAQNMRKEVDRYKQSVVHRLEESMHEWDKLVTTSRVSDQIWKKAPVVYLLPFYHSFLSLAGFLTSLPRKLFFFFFLLIPFFYFFFFFFCFFTYHPPKIFFFFFFFF
jgi:hypothetical protein